MYLDALEFLEEERDAWRPFEALAGLTDEQLEVAGRGGPRLVRPRPDGPSAGLAGARPRGRQGARGQRDEPGQRRQADADWDTRGGEVVNAEIERDWAALPMDELREEFATVPGELRGYLTVVPETRWLKHADHQRFFHDETIGHYEEHQADLAAILAAAGR